MPAASLHVTLHFLGSLPRQRLADLATGSTCRSPGARWCSSGPHRGRAAGAVPPATIVPIRWPVRGYALIESLALRGGGYRIVRRYPARAGRG